MSSASRFATHEVSNQPPPLEHTNLFEQDRALAAAAEREGAGAGLQRLENFGAWLGTPEAIWLGEQANRHPPELRSHDRFGRRIDEVLVPPGLARAHGTRDRRAGAQPALGGARPGRACDPRRRGVPAQPGRERRVLPDGDDLCRRAGAARCASARRRVAAENPVRRL